MQITDKLVKLLLDEAYELINSHYEAKSEQATYLSQVSTKNNKLTVPEQISKLEKCLHRLDLQGDSIPRIARDNLAAVLNLRNTFYMPLNEVSDSLELIPTQINSNPQISR